MNKEKLLKVADIIENAPPEQFHLGSWFGTLIEAKDSDSWEYFEDYELAEADELVGQGIVNPQLETIILSKEKSDTLKLACNTTACIAGWTVAMEYYENNLEWTKDQIACIPSYDISKSAQKILGLNGREATRLFYGDESSIWAEVSHQYGMGYWEAEFPELWKLHPKHAADVIRRVANGELKLDDSDDTEEESEARWGEYR